MEFWSCISNRQEAIIDQFQSKVVVHCMCTSLHKLSVTKAVALIEPNLNRISDVAFARSGPFCRVYFLSFSYIKRV